MNLTSVGRRYRAALLDNVIPFWMRHSPDPLYGGYLHCLDRDGTVIHTDKSVWLQAREVWLFSWLYNTFDRRIEWLDMARLGADFLLRHGRDPNGDWYFCLSRSGGPLVAPYNIFSDCFAVMAFAEYGRAAQNQEALDVARATYRRIQQRKDNPKGRWNKAAPGARSWTNLSLPMININISGVINGIAPDPAYERIMAEETAMVMDRFIDPEQGVIHENIGADGHFHDDCYEGRHINPGHGIEAMWFIMEQAARRGDRALAERCCQAIKGNLKFGWDRDFGGIYYFMDKLGKPHIELQWDMKLWWVHLETLIACLMGWQLTGDPELLDWFRRVDDYTWARFPDPDYGEWFGYLNRQGRVNNACKGNRWKGCFHLPRALRIVAGLCEQPTVFFSDPSANPSPAPTPGAPA